MAKFSVCCLIPLLLAGLFACQQDVRKEKLILIATTDVHGAIFPVDCLSGDSLAYGLARVHSLIEEQRQIMGEDRLIYLDNGDLLQGDPAAYFANYIDNPDKHLFARIMHFMGADAASVGNHDIECGHPVYDSLRKAFSFPWLAANAINKNTGEAYFEPYTILHKGSLRIALLGLTTPAVPRWLPQYLWEGIHFEDMVKSAEKWVEHIREKEKPDMLIGLFHSGADTSGLSDYEEGSENAAAAVAHRVPGFDLIIAGHDHRKWNMYLRDIEGDSVLILAPGSRARDVALVEIEATKKNSGWDIRLKGDILSTSRLPAHRGFMETFRSDQEKIHRYVNDTIAWLQDSLFARDALYGPAPFTELVHQVQLAYTGADISLTAPLSVSAILPAGPIKTGDLFHLYPYENLLYLMRLSGGEIKDMLEYAAEGWFRTMQNAGDGLLDYQRNEAGAIIFRNGQPQTRGISYNFSTASGLHYTLDLRAPAGNRIQISKLASGFPFHPDSIYQVALNSYRGSGGGGHLTRGAGIPDSLLADRIIHRSGEDIRALLIGWLQKQSPVKITMPYNWKCIPETWHQNGMEADIRFRRQNPN